MAVYAAADRGECTESEAERLVRSFLSAGVDTTINGIGHGGAAALLHICADEVRIIAFVGKQHLGRGPIGIHDRQIAFEVGGFAPSQRHSYGQAQRIDAEMDLGRKTTF